MRSAKKWRPEYKMPHGDDSNDSEIRETPESVARYIAALAGELAKMAKRNDLDTLSTLLDMACIEADQAAKQL